jgi:hypothetical protein
MLPSSSRLPYAVLALYGADKKFHSSKLKAQVLFCSAHSPTHHLQVTSFRRDVSFLPGVVPSKREYRYGLPLHVAWSPKLDRTVRLTPKVARRTLQVASLENLRDNRLLVPLAPVSRSLSTRDFAEDVHDILHRIILLSIRMEGGKGCNEPRHQQ